MSLNYQFDLKVEFPLAQFIFHYTGVQALQNILENKEFWASKSDFLNDYYEMWHIKDVFKRIHTFVMNSCNDDINNFFNGVQRLVDDYYNENAASEVYFISFSEDIDSLCLWSNYSGSEGYNIGLNREKYLLAQQKIVQAGIVDYYWIGKINYDEQKQQEILLNEIMLVYNTLKLNPSEENWNEAMTICRVLFEMYSMFFKKRGFQQEQEVRIAFQIVRPQTVDKFKTNLGYRTRNGSLIPYLAIPFKDDNPIASIMVGPKNNMDTSILGLKHFLKHKGYGDLAILKSQIPLRF